MRTATLKRETYLFLALQHRAMLHHSMTRVNRNSVTEYSA